MDKQTFFEITETTHTLVSADKHRFSLQLFLPDSTPSASLLMLPEIFGVRDGVKNQARKFAEHGIACAIPSFFDRIEAGLTYQYDQHELGLGAVKSIPRESLQLDLAESLNYMAQFSKPGILGYCWGGSLAFLSANWFDLSFSIAYYGTRIAQSLLHKPNCPMMFHFGENDHSISAENIASIRATNPHHTYFIYEGCGHAFSNNERDSFNSAASELAFSRSIEFALEHSAKQNS